MTESARQVLSGLGWRPECPASGWLAAALAALYVWVAALAVRRALAASPCERPVRWLAAAGVTVLSGALLAGAPDVVADAARLAARREGWYDERWAFQAWLVAGLVTGAVVAGCAWRARYPQGLALGAVYLRLGLLGVFAAVRAVSLHEVDALLRVDLGGVQLGRVAELALLLALASALRRLPIMEYAAREGEGSAPPGKGPLRVF